MFNDLHRDIHNGSMHRGACNFILKLLETQIEKNNHSNIRILKKTKLAISLWGIVSSYFPNSCPSPQQKSGLIHLVDSGRCAVQLRFADKRSRYRGDNGSSVRR